MSDLNLLLTETLKFRDEQGHARSHILCGGLSNNMRPRATIFGCRPAGRALHVPRDRVPHPAARRQRKRECRLRQLHEEIF